MPKSYTCIQHNKAASKKLTARRVDNRRNFIHGIKEYGHMWPMDSMIQN